MLNEIMQIAIAAQDPALTESAAFELAAAPTGGGGGASPGGGAGGGGGGTGGGGGGAPGGGGGFPPLFLFLIFGFILFMIISQVMTSRKEQKRRRELLGSLERHDKVRMTSGIIGTIVEIKDAELLVKVDENTNTRLRFTRDSVQAVLKKAGGGGGADADDGEIEPDEQNQ